VSNGKRSPSKGVYTVRIVLGSLGFVCSGALAVFQVAQNNPDPWAVILPGVAALLMLLSAVGAVSNRNR
jgi:hypothetical protein